MEKFGLLFFGNPNFLASANLFCTKKGKCFCKKHRKIKNKIFALLTLACLVYIIKMYRCIRCQRCKEIFSPRVGTLGLRCAVFSYVLLSRKGQVRGCIRRRIFRLTKKIENADLEALSLHRNAQKTRNRGRRNFAHTLSGRLNYDKSKVNF